MLTPSTTVASPLSSDSTATAKAATVEADSRADFRQQLKLATQHDAQLADVAATTRSAREAATEIPDPMTSLSTIAVAGAMTSVPAALEMMRSIAVQSAAGTLTDADRQALHAEYAQLSAHVVSTVGSVGASQQTQTATHDDGQARREDSDDHRTTLTQTRELPHQTVQIEPVERTVTTQRQTLVEDGHGPQKDPLVDFRTHELHVGTDSYEPVAVRQSVSHPTLPATTGHVETHAETQHTFVAQAAQITQFVQVAQTELIPPAIGVA